MDLFLGLIVIVGIVVFAFLLRQSSNNAPPPHSTKPRSAPSRPAPITRPKVETQPFNAQSAKSVHEERVLTGSAYVTDGDTIKIKNTQIRLFGVDAPELNHPYGKKAKWALHKLCKDQTITAKISDEDEYGRTVAHCYLPDGRDLSAEMVKQGLAIDWPKFSGGRYASLETTDARKKLWLADARQKGRMHVWKKFESRQEQ
nr:thermonuclease family protein [uncultured Shimia sp.]